MKSNHRSPVWPYLLVLGGLFVLCVNAPRGWQTRPAAHRAGSAERQAAAVQRKPPPRPTVLVAESTVARQDAIAPATERATPPPLQDIPTLANAADVDSPAAGIAQSPPASASEPQFPLWPVSSPVEDAADENTEADTFVSTDVGPPTDSTASAETATAGTVAADAATADAVMDDNATDHTAKSDAIHRDRELTAAPQIELADDYPGSEVADENVSDDATRNYDNWPLPLALIDGLEGLRQYPATRPWANELGELLDRLSTKRIDDPAASDVLADLRTKAGQAAIVATNLDGGEKRELEQVELDLLRRLGLWEKAAQATETELVSLQDADPDRAMQAALSDLDVLLSRAPIGQTWRNYLMLGRLEVSARDTRVASPTDRRRLAEKVLARMNDPRLSDAQREFLGEAELVELKRRLRGWSVEKLPLGELLYTVEDYEQARVASLGRTLAEQSEVLANSRDAAEKRLGCELTRQYRNANLRLVLTRELLNRLLPQPEPALEPVHDTIVGVPARGRSTTSTRLAVRLFPAQDQIRLGIEAAGIVDSQTASTAGPVTFFSQGASSYRVGKLVVIDRHGLRVGSAMADADNRTQLAGLQTDFDGVPILRNLVRGYALSQHEDKQDQARREVEVKVADRASQRLDAEVNARLAEVEGDFRRRILSALRQLELAPAVVQLTTTEQRVTARLRLAGHDQAGGHTPRPLAMSDSLASLQIHESALNNALARFRLAGRTFTLPELYQWIGERLGRERVELPDDLPDNVSITFAEKDPVRVRCGDGSVELTLAIAELDQGRRFWNDFEITVYYQPHREGLRLEFARDGSIELGGENYKGRTEFVLRGIFAKVFSHRHKLIFDPAAKHHNASLSTLAFSSAIVDNGWISITVADRAAHQAE